MLQSVGRLLSLLLLAGAVAAPLSLGVAADFEAAKARPGPRIVDAPPPVIEAGPPPVIEARPPPATGPLAPPPRVRFGCQRVWRCDNVVCEWRRGCWGVYGYMEGPYYTSTFARRQWEAHGWPPPPRR